MTSHIKSILTHHLPFLIAYVLLSFFGNGLLIILNLGVLLYYFRQNKGWVSFLILLPISTVVTFVTNQGFIPFPPPQLAVISFFLSLIFLLPFLFDKLFLGNVPKWLQLFILPSISQIFNLFLSKGPTGSMGYIANQLVDLQWLMQLTSIIGIFGIGFLMYLTASTLVQICNSLKDGKFEKRMVMTFCSIFLIIFGFGKIRILQSSNYQIESEKVKIATITAEQTPLGEALYESFTGEKKTISRTMTQADPDNQTIQLALLDFKDHSDSQKYALVRTIIERQFKELLARSKEAVDSGAKIILVSEAEIITTKGQEDYFITKTQNFARKNQVYFFLGIGSLIPELKSPDSPYVENKIMVIDDQGTVRDIYFKNVPVQGVDPSVPGNGKLRAIETDYGRITYAICYDTDFPDLMRQAGELKAELLLVPAGDWKNISPYHTKTTNIRSIENGISQVRAVSGGLSSAVDPYGNYLAEDDFFEDFDHLMIAEVPIKRKKTIYSKIGDITVPLSFLIVLSSFSLALLKFLMTKKRLKLKIETDLPLD